MNDWCPCGNHRAEYPARLCPVCRDEKPGDYKIERVVRTFGYDFRLAAAINRPADFIVICDPT